MLIINELNLNSNDNKDLITLKAMIIHDKIYFDAYHASDFAIINLGSLKDDRIDNQIFLNCLNNSEDIKNTLIKILIFLIDTFKIKQLKVTGIDDATDILKMDIVLSSLLNTTLASFELIKD
ncbi:hypothetical protein [Acinetobacter sp. NyZ410]|uniref:hypothetical protein n=1 Tax=Acinetobacter sp. NyZ410 TaxID=2929509 RepID=UPI001FB90F5A|nr:hypothetical protein [Acinetobacter sp. NyZ410]UOH16917.1 hypothetical protein MTO68_13885 [Acinetobacter sp. NyZ410]